MRSLLRLAVGLFDDLAEADDLPRGVGHLDADGILAGDWRHDADARHAQGDGEVVGQAGDLAQPEAGLQLDFKLGYDRSGLDFDYANIKTKILERLLENRRLAADVFFLLFKIEGVAGEQKLDARQLVVGGVLRRFVELQVFRFDRFRLADAEQRAETAAFRLGSLWRCGVVASGVLGSLVYGCLYKCFHGRLHRRFIGYSLLRLLLLLALHAHGSNFAASRTVFRLVGIQIRAPLQLPRGGRADVEHALADALGRLADDPGH